MPDRPRRDEKFEFHPQNQKQLIKKRQKEKENGIAPT